MPCVMPMAAHKVGRKLNTVRFLAVRQQNRSCYVMFATPFVIDNNDDILFGCEDICNNVPKSRS